MALRRNINGGDAIDIISEIRSHNNRLWMKILRLAYQSAPKETRRIIKSINENDKEVTKWLGKL